MLFCFSLTLRFVLDLQAPLLLQEDQEAEPMFASILRDEICKINDFYLMKLREYEDRFKEVQEALEFEAVRIQCVLNSPAYIEKHSIYRRATGNHTNDQCGC